MVTRFSIGLLALCGATMVATAQDRACSVWSPGDPVNLKSPYQSLLSLCGIHCPSASHPATEFPPGGADCDPALPYRQWCGYPCDFWFLAEANLYRIKSSHLPPLATTGPLGQPVLGADDAGPNTLVGGRFTLGAWINYAQTFGLEGTYFFLAEQTEGEGVIAADSTLFRPIFNVVTSSPDTLLIGGPGGAGALEYSVSTSFQEASGSTIFNLACDPGLRVDALVGVTYLELIDDLHVLESTARLENVVGDPAFATSNRFVSDVFETRSRFYGLHLGVRGQMQRGPWSGSLLLKLALGESHERVGVTGVSYFPALAGGVTASPGGVLANAGNLGSYDRERFSAVPQLELKLGYQLCSHARVFGGYGFTYWNHVARATEQVSLSVDPRAVPTVQFPAATEAASPRFEVKSSSFWLHGLGVGLEVSF